MLLQLGHVVQRGPARGHQPDPVRRASAGPAGAALALERHRRGVPLPRRRARLLAEGSQDRRGLAARAAVQAGPGRHRRHELRRRDQAVPRRGRPLPIARARRDAQSDHERHSECQSERRRTAASDGGAVLRRPRHRPAWLAHGAHARHREYRARGTEGDTGAHARCRRHRHRLRAQARHRGLRRGAGRRAGHRAHALRRRDAGDPQQESTIASTTSGRTTSCRRASTSSRTTTAGASFT